MAELFNADKLSAKREADTVVIGARKFTPVRRTNALMRQVRTLTREQEKIDKQQDEAEEAGKPDEAEELGVQSARMSLQLIACVLRDEKNNPPDVDFLDEHLDLVFAADLQMALFPVAAGPYDGDGGYLKLMAAAAYFAHVSPAEFEGMDPDDTKALVEEARDLHDADLRFLVDVLKALRGA